MKYEYHPDGTVPTNGEIFVFGSNRAGIHGTGDARVALDHFGAVVGEGFGFNGQSYAIPTKNRVVDLLCMIDIYHNVMVFKQYAEAHPHLKFFMTRVGCGLAGLKDSDVAPLFAKSPTNIIFPEPWKEFLES